jgi:hypothetical protein
MAFTLNLSFTEPFADDCHRVETQLQYIRVNIISYHNLYFLVLLGLRGKHHAVWKCFIVFVGARPLKWTTSSLFLLKLNFNTSFHGWETQTRYREPILIIFGTAYLITNQKLLSLISRYLCRLTNNGCPRQTHRHLTALYWCRPV